MVDQVHLGRWLRRERQRRRHEIHRPDEAQLPIREFALQAFLERGY